MPARFKFLQNEAEYEALGSYGVNNGFVVTRILHETTRAQKTAGSPSGAPIEIFVPNVETRDALLAELRNQFPGLTGFAPF